MTDPAATVASRPPRTVLLIGNPNTGKSTLFNALSGIPVRIANFPGCTVEHKVGRFEIQGQPIDLVDLPGTYSLSARSPDELVAVDVLLGRHADVGQPHAVLCIADAANLERNLYLLTQVRELGLPTILCLNMWDATAARGITIDVEQLSRRLQMPVVATSAQNREGLDALQAAILAAVPSNNVETESASPNAVGSGTMVLPEIVQHEVRQIQEWLTQLAQPTSSVLKKEADPVEQASVIGESRLPERGRPLSQQSASYGLVLRALLDVGGEMERRAMLEWPGEARTRLTEARDRLATAGFKAPFDEPRVRYAWIREQLLGVASRPDPALEVTRTDRIDQVLTHRVAGLAIFIAVMFVVFQSIFTWASPIMDVVQTIQAWAGDLAQHLLAPGTLRSLLVDGLVAGVGSVLVFIPQIALLFLFIGLLEDCGYMARAAYLMDRLMTRVGLSGKSFLPLMSSFACAIPGIMATRTIESRRDRLLTILLAPLMSCSARLPVYALMIGTFIPATAWLGGWLKLHSLVLLFMYLLGAIVAVPIAWLLRKTIVKGETPPFVMELPEYKWPSFRVVSARVYEQVRHFLEEAGTMIFATSVLVWAAGYFPGDHTQELALINKIEKHQPVQLAVEPSNPQLTTDDTLKTEPEVADSTADPQLAAWSEELNVERGRLLRNSFLGRVGIATEPLVRPLGWDWRIGMAAIASFPAREVVIATMGTIFSLGGDVDEDDPGLQATLSNAKWPDGRPLFNVAVAVSLMVFFALCAQCGSTLVVIYRETNHWFWPVWSFVSMTGLAYIMAAMAYAVLSWATGTA